MAKAASVEMKSWLNILMPKSDADSKGSVLILKDAPNPGVTHFPLLCPVSGEGFWYCCCVKQCLAKDLSARSWVHQKQEACKP